MIRLKHILLEDIPKITYNAIPNSDNINTNITPSSNTSKQSTPIIFTLALTDKWEYKYDMKNTGIPWWTRKKGTDEWIDMASVIGPDKYKQAVATLTTAIKNKTYIKIPQQSLATQQSVSNDDKSDLTNKTIDLSKLKPVEAGASSQFTPKILTKTNNGWMQIEIPWGSSKKMTKFWTKSAWFTNGSYNYKDGKRSYKVYWMSPK